MSLLGTAVSGLLVCYRCWDKKVWGYFILRPFLNAFPCFTYGKKLFHCAQSHHVRGLLQIGTLTSVGHFLQMYILNQQPERVSLPPHVLPCTEYIDGLSDEAVHPYVALV